LFCIMILYIIKIIFFVDLCDEKQLLRY